MVEADLYGPLWHGANAEGWHVYRIADGSVGKKPCDLAGCASNGLAVCLEAKLLKDGRPSKYEGSPYWTAYAPHQIAWLGRHAEAHALALAVEYDAVQREMSAWVLTAPWHFGLASKYDAPTMPGRPVPRVVMARAHLPNQEIWVGWRDILALHGSSLPWNGRPLAEYRQRPF